VNHLRDLVKMTFKIYLENSRHSRMMNWIPMDKLMVLKMVETYYGW